MDGLTMTEKAHLLALSFPTDEEVEEDLRQTELKLNESILTAQRALFARKMQTDPEYRERFLREQAEGLQPGPNVSYEQAVKNRLKQLNDG